MSQLLSRNPRALAARTIRRHATLVLGVALVALCGRPANAGFVISATFSQNNKVDAASQAVINAAIKEFQNTFRDNMTATIYFESNNNGTAGSTDLLYNPTSKTSGGYANFLSALTADATSKNDKIALDNLPKNPNGAGPPDPNFKNPVPNNMTNQIYLTTANIKALPNITGTFDGIKADDGNRYDGIISIDFGVIKKVGFGLLGVVEHEIDEVLGLGSGLNDGNDGKNGGVLKGGSFIQPEDLYRFSDKKTRSFDAGAAVKSYLSIDNGNTKLVNLNQSGGGSDFGDWVVNNPSQVQDFRATKNTNPHLGVNEITGLDVIGYNVVPEPGSLTLAAVGVAGLLLGGWRTRRASMLQSA